MGRKFYHEAEADFKQVSFQLTISKLQSFVVMIKSMRTRIKNIFAPTQVLDLEAENVAAQQQLKLARQHAKRSEASSAKTFSKMLAGAQRDEPTSAPAKPPREINWASSSSSSEDEEDVPRAASNIFAAASAEDPLPKVFAGMSVDKESTAEGN